MAGALRCAPGQVSAFAAAQLVRVPFRQIVVYCVYGHHVSANAVAELRAAGLNAVKLDGGFEGGEDGVDAAADIALWRMETPPKILKRADWGVTGEQPSRWVTRAGPKIDRIACPWLIHRFIDPQAVFHYRPTDQVLDAARSLNAVAFDTPGAPVSHRGELCSFDALLAAFDLRDAALEQLARIVRGADTHTLGLAPESAGLLALSLGLSQLHSDDHAMLAAAMPLYDALYACCQSRVRAARQGTPPETHNWQPDASQAAQP